MQNKTLPGKLTLLILTWLLCRSGGLIADDMTASVLPREFVVRVVDEAGVPAQGVEVGSVFDNYGQDDNREKPGLHLVGEDFLPAVLTDETGKVKIRREHLFRKNDPRQRLIIATTKDRISMGLFILDPQRTQSDCEIVLQETCQIAVRPVCLFLKENGLELRSTQVAVYWNGHPTHYLRTSEEQHQFQTIAGEYELEIDGSETYKVKRQLNVTSNESGQVIDVDLPQTRLAELIGHEAPELEQIKGWYGGDAVSLKDLRGKVIILEFWGTWCGPCLYRMPGLFHLHDQYHEQGLEIIAVHDDSLADIAELDQLLIPIRKQRWMRRDFPFRVALDGGGERSVSGREKTVRGATTALYGVPMWPFKVLIDREGIVRGRYVPSLEEHQKLLQELIHQVPSAINE